MSGSRQFPTAPPDVVAVARDLLAAAERICVLTGAGVSTDSGIPDFRGPDGVWTRNPEAEKLSTISHYMSDPEIRIRAWRARMDHPAWMAEPNEAHLALAGLDATDRLSLLVTQNIDGLHALAGVDPERIVEVHGSMRRVRCTGCGTVTPMGETLDRVRSGEVDPPCVVCGSILKSDVIFFGEGLVPEDIQAAFAEAADCDLLLVVGTTLQVYPVAEMVPIALRAGGDIVIVNGEATEMDALADVVIRGSISETLPAILGTPLSSVQREDLARRREAFADWQSGDGAV